MQSHGQSDGAHIPAGTTIVIAPILIMGNLCGKQSRDSEAFAQPGRTLGSALPPPSSAPRASVPPKVSSQGGRQLGDGQAPTTDAGRAAAQAAEERAARANQRKGKLGKELAKERKQTNAETLSEASRTAQRQRDADQAAEARNYN